MSYSIHNHHVLAVTVDAKARTIGLRTANPEKTGPQFGMAVFTGVAAYVFRGDALGTILFDIEPMDALALYRESAGALQLIHAQTGDHAAWVRDERVAAGFIKENALVGYRITSSIGLEGEVWARSPKIHEIQKQ